MFPHWPPFWQHQGEWVHTSLQKAYKFPQSIMKIAVHSYFVSERQILCKRWETTGEQTWCCCGSTGLCISSCSLGESIMQASACPASSCPPAIDKEIHTQKCTNTPNAKSQVVKACIQIHWSHLLRCLAATRAISTPAPADGWSPRGSLGDETPTPAVCGVTSSGSLGQCPAGFRVKI